MAGFFRKLRAERLGLRAESLELRAERLGLIVIMCVMLFASCDNSEPIGDLLGQWKLEEMTYQGVTTHPEDMYIRFQSQYVQTHILSGTDSYGHYTRSGETMTMKFYYSGQSETYPTDPYNAAVYLVPYNFYNDTSVQRTQEDIDKGLYPVNVVFKVEKLDADNLILTNADGRWVFTKW